MRLRIALLTLVVLLVALAVPRIASAGPKPLDPSEVPAVAAKIKAKYGTILKGIHVKYSGYVKYRKAAHLHYRTYQYAAERHPDDAYRVAKFRLWHWRADHAYARYLKYKKHLAAQAASSNHWSTTQVHVYIVQKFGPYSGKAISVATCESHLHWNSHNPSGATGVFQIMMPLHAKDMASKVGTSDAYNAKANIDYAYIMSHGGTNWSAWVCQ